MARPGAAAPPITVRDVAREAGVSSMTVSRVINGGVNVAPETRVRVERALRKLDYRRNENARSIRPGQRTGLIGVVITNITNPYYAQLLNGVEDVLSRAGRRVLVGVSHGNPAAEAALVADFRGRQVEGLVVVPTGGVTTHLGPRALNSLPLVLASRASEDVEADTVIVDDRHGSYEGVASLLARGHERIAFIGNAPSVSTSQRRYEGFRDAHADAGVRVVDELVCRSAALKEQGREAVSAMLALPAAPDAYFATNNRLAVGALEALLPYRQAHPGDDPAPLLAFDNFDLSHLIDYPIELIDHDARALGREAGRLLLTRLDAPGDQGPALQVTLPTRRHAATAT